jgi:hypothetical protein
VRVSVTPRPLFTPGKDLVPIVQEAGWAPGPVWTSAENFDPTEIRSPDRPAHSQSLYRLHYSAQLFALAKVNSQVTLGFHAVIMICLGTLRTAFISDMLNSYEKAGAFMYFLEHQAYRLQLAFNCLDLSNVLRALCIF